jgi:hypothetical protein
MHSSVLSADVYDVNIECVMVRFVGSFVPRWFLIKKHGIVLIYSGLPYTSLLVSSEPLMWARELGLVF